MTVPVNIATLAYLPPLRLPFASAFRQNIRRFKTTYPLILFSDTPDHHSVEFVESPERQKYPKVPWAMSNYCFMKALQIAVQRRIELMILMEADCRVNGDHWDQRIAEEFATFPEAVMGGTPVCWNLNRSGRALTASLIDYAAGYQKRMGLPMALHGIFGNLVGKNQPQHQQACLYPNGAAAIYSVPALQQLFPSYDDSRAALITAWDMHIGFQMHNTYGDGLPLRIAALTSVFSGYGDEVLAEAERKEWLTSGRVCAVHQIKDNWQP